MSDAVASVYNPSTKENYEGKPLIMITAMKQCLPTAKARRLIPDYLEANNPGVEFIQVNIEESDCKDWIDKMGIAATGERKKEYVSPLFYFVNTDGSVKRFSGFYPALLTDTKDKCVEFRWLISKLR